VAPSRVLHRELELPIKCARNELYSGLICIRFHLDLEDGLSFVSIVRQSVRRASSALLHFDGSTAEKQRGFPVDVVYHPDTQAYFRQLRSGWQQDKVILEEAFSLMIGGTSYDVRLSSPLLGLFLEQEKLRQKNPPIHVDVSFDLGVK
jgi:hypothetical protein